MGIQFDGVNNRVTTGDIVSETGTISGNLGIGGTLTYEDVTNIDSVGVITARDGLRVTGIATVTGGVNVTANSTFTGNIDMKTGGSGNLLLGDDQLLRLGDNNELTIQHSSPGPGNFIEGDSAGKNLFIRSKLNQDQLKLVPDGQVEAYFAGSKKFETTGSGTITTGIVTAAQSADAVTFLKGNSVGIGSTTTTGRDAGIGTAIGEIIYNASDSVMQVWTGTLWESVKFKPPITVSGGTISDSARSGYITHTFTSSGSLVTDGELTSAEIFVIGGGGGGGGNRYGGGGGAGGANYGTGITLTATTHPILIGNGGSGGTAQGPSSPQGSKGSDGGSSAFEATAPHPLYRVGRGGGGGGSHDVPSPHRNGQPGGSGGGSTSYTGSSGGGQGQTAYNPGKPTNYGQPGAGYMNAGSPSHDQNGWAAAGGGGATQAGFGPPSPGANDQRFRGGGNGGDGVQLSISGTATYYGGGGGGSSFSYVTTPAPAHQAPNQLKCRGGNGGGGCGNNQPNSAPTQHGPGLNPYAAGTNGSSPNQHGVVNTGSGGAGAQPTYGFSLIGGNGGSGLIIVAYPKTQAAGEVRF